MSIYDEMRVIAGELLTEFGQGGVVHQRVVPGVGPPENPGVGVTVQTPLNEVVAKGVTAQFVDGSMILASDLELVIPASKLQPTLRDTYLINGSTHTTVTIKPVPAVGTPVVYRVIVRA